MIHKYTVKTVKRKKTNGIDEKDIDHFLISSGVENILMKIHLEIFGWRS